MYTQTHTYIFILKHTYKIYCCHYYNYFSYYNSELINNFMRAEIDVIMGSLNACVVLKSVALARIRFHTRATWRHKITTFIDCAMDLFNAERMAVCFQPSGVSSTVSSTSKIPKIVINVHSIRLQTP